MSKKKADYKVGYRKPPKKNRFKPGTSGNPSGRPKEVFSFWEIFFDELYRELTYIENGIKNTSSSFTIATRKTMNKAMQGDNNAYKTVCNLALQGAKKDKRSIQATLKNCGNVMPRKGLTAEEAAKAYQEILRRAKLAAQEKD